MLIDNTIFKFVSNIMVCAEHQIFIFIVNRDFELTLGFLF
jgi:hypothetical protein